MQCDRLRLERVLADVRMHLLSDARQRAYHRGAMLHSWPGSHLPGCQKHAGDDCQRWKLAGLGPIEQYRQVMGPEAFLMIDRHDSHQKSALMPRSEVKSAEFGSGEQQESCTDAITRGERVQAAFLGAVRKAYQRDDQLHNSVKFNFGEQPGKRPDAIIRGERVQYSTLGNRGGPGQVARSSRKSVLMQRSEVE